MNCNDVRDRIEELVDDLLPPEEAVGRHQHVRGCPDCAEHLAEAKRFHALIAAEGSDALQDWHAHGLAARAAEMAGRDAVSAQAAPTPATPRIPATPALGSAVAVAAARARPARTAPVRSLSLWRRSGARYAAAAAVLAAGLVVGVGAIGPDGPQVLAAGKQLTLEKGVEALTGPGRGIRAERTLRILVEPDTDGARVRVDGGAALFRIDADRHCHVATPGGLAKADGSTFLLEVRQDGSVAVTVLAGEVRFDGKGDEVQLASGERVEVDVDGDARLVSRARVEELELSEEMSSLENAGLHRETETLREELGTLRHAADGAAEAAGGGVAEPGDLPWGELGAALRAMLGGRGFSDADSQKATGVFLVHADAIRQLTGERHPMGALTHPAFLQGVATGFMDALEPDAHPECRVAAADGMRAAAQRVQFVLDGDPVPTEALAAHQRLARDILVAVRDNLGEEAANELAIDLPRGWDPLRAFAWRRTGAVEKMSAWWVRKLTLDESQAAALEPMLRRYVEETLSVQTAIEDRLGVEEAARILFPKRRGFGSRRPSAREPGEEAPTRPKTTAVERLNRLDAELDIARPRIDFERAVLGLLREDQRERGLGKSFGLPTFQDAAE